MTTPATAPGLRGDLFGPARPTRGLLDRVGGKWVAMTIKVLTADGELRCAELKRRVPGVSAKMLAQTRRALERDGLVPRHVEPSVPPAVSYRATDLGRSLDHDLAPLREWAEIHMVEVAGQATGAPGSTAS